MKRFTALVALNVLVVVGTGTACGIGTQDSASRVPSSQVPYGLLDPAETAPRATSPGPDPLTVPICLIAPGGQRIATVARSGSANSAADVLDRLGEGPTVDEADAGWRTALPAEDVVMSTVVSGGEASVDLDAGFADLNRRNQLLAIAQLVCTLTSQPGIGRVSFSIDGEPIEVPRGDGALVSGSVSRDAYRSLLTG